MSYTPTTEEIEESYIYQQYDANGRYVSAKEAGEAFDRWLAEHDRQVKAQGARTERERLASLAEHIRTSHDVAECAGYVEGETGRQEAIDRWLYLCEEPDVWLRGLADDPEWLDAHLFEAWEEGFDAGATPCPVTGLDVRCGNCATCDPTNPYKEEA